MLLLSTPAWGQVSEPLKGGVSDPLLPGMEYESKDGKVVFKDGQPVMRPIGVARPVCQPIGRTAKGELVYSMDCAKIPEEKK